MSGRKKSRKKLHKARSGAYYKILPNGRSKFVKKPGKKKKKRKYNKKSKFWRTYK